MKYLNSHKIRFGRKRVSTYSWRDRGITPTGFDMRLLTIEMTLIFPRKYLGSH